MYLMSFDIWRLHVGMLYLAEQIMCCPILASTVHIGMEFPGVVQVGSPALKVKCARQEHASFCCLIMVKRLVQYHVTK